MAPLTLTPIAAPAAPTVHNEYDDYVAAAAAQLAADGQWLSGSVASEKEAEEFKRKFGQAANRAGKSRKFSADTVNADGTVTLSFTVGDKISRPKKERTDVTLTDGTAPVPPTAS